jgi:hypothetical protein
MNMRPGSKRHPDSGAALMMAVLLVAILTIGSSALWRHLHMTLGEGQRVEMAEAARALAEGGLDQAVARLRVQPDAYRGEQNTPLGEGRFSVTVEPLGFPGAYRLISHGELLGGKHVLTRQTLIAELALSPAGEVRRFQWSIEKKR